MLEYAPWSKTSLSNALSLYRKGDFSILDFELGGGCNFHCQYCDSPNRMKAGAGKETLFSSLADQMPVSWIYICGIGEPMFRDNRVILKNILELCGDRDIRCSAFSNVSLIDQDILGHIESGTLSLLFKFDSLHADVLNGLYGTTRAQKQIDNVKCLCDHAYIADDETNLAASIVLTRKNIDELPRLLDFCENNRVFPFVAELEHAGRGTACMNDLALSKKELCQVKDLLETTYGYFNTPFCPSAIAGIHVDNGNNVVVDARTGLSCHWFWMEDPQVKSLGLASPSTSYDEIKKNLMQYRRDKLPDVRKIAKTHPESPIGGCGGDISKLLNLYLSCTMPQTR